MVRRLVEEPPKVRRVEVSDAVKVPHDPVNEQVLLVAATVPELRERVLERVAPDEFLVKEHVVLWAGLKELARRKLDYSPDTLRQVTGGAADTAYLVELCAAREGATPTNLDHHIRALEWDRVRANVVTGPLTELLRLLREVGTPRDLVQAQALTLSEALQRGATSGLIREATALTAATMALLRERKEQACYPYGIDGLDREDGSDRWRMLPGCAPGKVTVVTGTPGSGKSTLAARIVLAQIAAGRRVLFGAWEMGSESTLELLAAMGLGMSRYTVTAGLLSHDRECELEAECERLQASGLIMMEPPGAAKAGSHVARGDRAGNERALDQIHGVIAETGADVAVFDLWKRVLRNIEPNEEEQALIRQQDICKSTRCHGVLLQQQRYKDIEQRPDKRPTREGIKGSGAYVEIADTIIGVHRPALWKACDDVVLELDVLKQRWGKWPLAVEFAWDAEYGAISGGASIAYDSPDLAASAGGGAVDDFMAAGTGKRRRRNVP